MGEKTSFFYWMYFDSVQSPTAAWFKAASCQRSHSTLDQFQKVSSPLETWMQNMGKKKNRVQAGKYQSYPLTNPLKVLPMERCAVDKFADKFKCKYVTSVFVL